MGKQRNPWSKEDHSCCEHAVKHDILQPPVEGLYEFKSGKGNQDLIHFILFRMHHWEYYYREMVEEAYSNVELSLVAFKPN